MILTSRPSFDSKTDFVFSGGGVRGCWQWEFYHLLKPYFDIHSFTGASTGSLTAMAAALDIPYEYLDALYEEVCRTDAKAIFEPKVFQLKNGKLKKKLNFYWNLAFKLDKLPGLMKIDPLIKTIERILTEFPAWKYKFYFYTVDLHTGSKIALCPDDFDSVSELARGIAASCAIPVLVEPIRDLVTKKGIFKCCVDGGVREGFPLKLAFDNMIKGVPHQIVGLGCNAKEMTPEENLQGLIQIGGASAYNGLNELMLGDIEGAQLMNYLVRENAAVAEDRKDTPITLYHYKGGCGTLEFTPGARMSMKETAKEDFERFEQSFIEL